MEDESKEVGGGARPHTEARKLERIHKALRSHHKI